MCFYHLNQIHQMYYLFQMQFWAYIPSRIQYATFLHILKMLPSQDQILMIFNDTQKYIPRGAIILQIYYTFQINLSYFLQNQKMGACIAQQGSVEKQQLSDLQGAKLMAMIPTIVSLVDLAKEIESKDQSTATQIMDMIEVLTKLVSKTSQMANGMNKKDLTIGVVDKFNLLKKTVDSHKEKDAFPKTASKEFSVRSLNITSEMVQVLKQLTPQKKPQLDLILKSLQVGKAGAGPKIISNIKPGQKKGDNNPHFQNLKELKVQHQTHNKQGYKLFNHITCNKELDLLVSKYLPLALSLRKNNTIFKDPNFPPIKSSLTDLDDKSSKISNVSQIEWKHYKDIYPNPQLQGKIEPNDIDQGALGDCYFLSSLAGLAEYQNLISRLFEYHDLECGYFLIWLCIDGHWKLYEIDGYIPISSVSKKPLFAHGAKDKQELWVILLQKAYAKAYGCYEHISGGFSFEAIKDLSGAPGQSFSHNHKQNDKDVMWNKLVNAHNHQFIMTCGTDQNSGAVNKLSGHSESITKEGIVLGHAYSILQIAIYKNQKLIQLRNPWGQTEWNGDWSDKSAKWTADAKLALNYNDFVDDGIFWMSYQDFIDRYQTTAINYIRPSYYYTSEIRSKTKYLLIKIDGHSFKHGFVMITQHDHRHKGKQAHNPYTLSNIIALTYKDDKVIRKITEESYRLQREGSVEITDVEEGAKAIVIVTLEQPVQIELCTYADKKLKYELKEDFNSLLEYMKGLAIIEPSEQKEVEKSQKYKSWLTVIGGVAFNVYKNISNEAITLTIKVSKPNNINISPGQKVLKLGIGGIECIQGSIINRIGEYSYGFGPINIRLT